MHRGRGRVVASGVIGFLLVVGFAAAPEAQELQKLGQFNHVTATPSGHCSGESLDLWLLRGRALGLLHIHEGLCGDPPCSVIEDVSYTRGAGALSFSTTVHGAAYRFDGLVRRDDVIGQLNGRRVRLERERDDAAVDSDRTIEGWCGFWTRIKRCGGVTELCTSLRQ